MRFPTIPTVARAVRMLSAALAHESPVQLLVNRLKPEEWEVVPGEVRVTGVHDHCWVGSSRVPGQNKQGRPRRFKSDDVARDLIAQIRTQAAQATQASQKAPGRSRMARGSTPVVAPEPFRIGALVAFYGVPGRVVGHATIERPDGPLHVHLVEATLPALVPAWNLTVQVVAVEDSALAPWVPPADSPRATSGARYTPHMAHA